MSLPFLAADRPSGTRIVLLHSPLSTVRSWGGLPGALRELGREVVLAEITDDTQPPYAERYIARAALETAEAGSGTPVLLAAMGAAGPLLPQLGAAQRAAHRPVAGYLFVDALLPQPGTPTRQEIAATQVGGGSGDPAAAVRYARPRPAEFFTEPLPAPQDWPDAPCGYLRTDAAFRTCARLAGQRGWPAAESPAEAGPLAAALLDLAARF